ncbi:MAG TPA: hypothetical protein VEA58_12260 [Anaerovoracaceae bacterium]|nr:hypothetical protein [Anaerovoracaceae bacterium]
MYYHVIERGELKKYLTEEEALRWGNLNEKLCESREDDGRQRVNEVQHIINATTKGNIKYAAKRLDTGNEIIGTLLVMDGRFNAGHCYILPETTSIQFDDEMVTCEIGGFYEVHPDTVRCVTY